MRRRRPGDEEAFISGATAETSSEPKGRTPPEDTQRINANIPSDLYRALKMQAVKEDRTMTDILTDLIRRYVQE